MGSNMARQEKIVVFSGTTEGREYSQRLSADGVSHLVCVATDYGKEVMVPSPYADIRVGRMDVDGMKRFFEAEHITKVVDATHPFAVKVTENIRAAMEMVMPEAEGEGNRMIYERISRDIPPADAAGGAEPMISCENAAEAAAFLSGTDGNILLTTGSKELKQFAKEAALGGRLFVRVLPAAESLEACAECGIARSHIIAMQGPFSVGMNVEMLRQYQIRWLVTKNTGQTGGFPEKLRAAEMAGCGCVVIGQPEGAGIGSESQRKVCSDRDGGVRSYFDITLCGMGAGSEAEMTVAVRQAVQSADVLLGAKRVLGERKGRLDTQAIYRADDILAYLRNIAAANNGGRYRVCVLFSGDTGFYSGCASVYKALCEEKERGRFAGSVNILPGVSSVSMLSARIGVPYQDAVLFSVHGREKEAWEKELRRMLGCPADSGQDGDPTAQKEGKWENKIIFVLLSGKQDLTEIQRLLLDCGQDRAEISIGYNLFLEDEQVVRTAAGDLRPEDFAEGLFTVCIAAKERERAAGAPENEADTNLPKNRIPIVHFPDTAFWRRPKLPMTKQEIRSIVFSKLELTRDAVFYDIGSGTGSIAVTAAASQGAFAGAGSLRVLAFERKKEACELIRQNADRLGAGDVAVFCGEAPDIFGEIPSGLEKPTHAFIGGSGGRLEEIYADLIRRNPSVRIVMTAITMETVQECYRLREAYGLDGMEIVQVNIAREHALGSYHSMERGKDVYVVRIGE